jgi:hypothetical protein
MSSTLISKAIPLTQIAVAAATFTASYVNAGSFTSPAIMLLFVSTLDAAVQVSFDGTNDHIAIPAGSTTPVYLPINFKSNNSFLPPSTIFVKEIGNPTTGSLYVCAFSAAIM